MASKEIATMEDLKTVPKRRVISYVKQFERIKHKNFGFFTSNGNNVEEEAKSLVNLKPTVIREVLSILNNELKAFS